MKKIKITFMLLIMCAFSLMIKGKSLLAKSNSDALIQPLVLIKGDKMPNLECSGFTLIENTVNINTKGTYIIKYQNNENKEITERTIYVVDRNDEQDYIYAQEKIDLHLFDEDIYLIKKLNEEEYLIVTKVENEINQDITYDYNLYYLKNESIVWCKTLIKESISEIIEIVVNDDLIYILGIKYFKYSKMDIMLMVYDFSGEYKKLNIYTGMKEDIATSLIVTTSEIFILGYTSSSDGDFSSNGEQSDSFMLKINKETLKVIDTFMYGLDKIDKIENAVFDGSYIYAVQYFIFMDSLPTYKIIKIDRFGNVISDERILGGYGQKIKKITLKNELLYVAVEEASSSYICVFDKSLNNKTIDLNEFSANLILKDVIFKEDSIIYLYLKRSSPNTYIIRVYSESAEKVVGSASFELEQPTNVNLNDDFTLLCSKNEELFLYKLNIVFFHDLITLKIYDETFDIKDRKIYINDDLAMLTDKSNLSYNPKQFGRYEVFLYYTGKYFDFAYYDNLTVMSNVSVKTNEIYDLNLKLTFNGEGLLNDMHIDSGFVIKDVGSYHLKVIGLNNVAEEYNFLVEEISQSKNEKIFPDKVNTILNNTFNDYLFKCEEIEQDPLFTLENTSKTTTTFNFWPLLIPSVTLGFSLFIILKRS